MLNTPAASARNTTAPAAPHGAVGAVSSFHVRGPVHTVHMPTVTELLEFEATWPRHTGHKEQAIIERFSIPPARYYVLLHRAAATKEGQAADAITAHRVLARTAA